MEECMADLVPVADWDWSLIKVTWHNRPRGEQLVKWLIAPWSTAHYDIQDRWPSDHWIEYEMEFHGDAKEPRRLPNHLGGVRHEDPWEAGERAAKLLVDKPARIGV